MCFRSKLFVSTAIIKLFHYVLYQWESRFTYKMQFRTSLKLELLIKLTWQHSYQMRDFTCLCHSLFGRDLNSSSFFFLPYVYSNFIHNCFKLEKTQLSIYWRMGRKIACQYNGTLLSNKEEENLLRKMFL